jgi:hypothetical protein
VAIFSSTAEMYTVISLVIGVGALIAMFPLLFKLTRTIEKLEVSKPTWINQIRHTRKDIKQIEKTILGISTVSQLVLPAFFKNNPLMHALPMMFKVASQVQERKNTHRGV